MNPKKRSLAFKSFCMKKKFTRLSNATLRFPAFLILLLFIMATSSHAQLIRSFTQIYSDNLKGGHTVFGNTITAVYSSGSGSTGVVNTTAMNNFGSYSYGATSIYLNDNSNIQFLDVDGTGAPATSNSSSADLVLPAGTNVIRFARLYWGGRIKSGNGGAANINLRSVKIRKGASGAYQSIVAPAAQVDKSQVNAPGTDSTYQAYIDVTAFISSNGTGTYTVADITAATGSISGGGYFAGWSIVVVYENTSLPYSSIRLYDGYMQVYNDGSPITQSITLTGLNAPSDPLNPQDAVMTTFTWEGDASLAASADNPAGDFIKVNGTAVSNALNPVTNFWNGTISKNGEFVTAKNPDFKNQMSVDIDEVYVGVGYGISPDATTVEIQFGTEADQYFPSVFAFTMLSKDPTVILNKAVTSSILPFDLLNPNEILTYTLSGGNNGMGDAVNCVITDTIPSSVSYVPGSLNIISAPGGFTGMKTDAPGDDQAFAGISGGKTYVKFYIGTGATSSAGGVLQKDESYSVQFKCLTPPNASALYSVSNTGRITAESVGGDPFVDDGTAIIGPQGSPLSVRLSAFSAILENGVARLSWTTQSETDNERFEIERSADAISFTGIAVLPGNGTTGERHDYRYADPVNSLSDKIIFYRLRMVETGGKNSFSQVIALRLSGNSVIKNYQVFPNPFTDHIKLSVYSTTRTAATIRIHNSAGQLLVQRAVEIQPGQNIIVINDLSGLPAGMHQVNLITGEGVITNKIMKQ